MKVKLVLVGVDSCVNIINSVINNPNIYGYFYYYCTADSVTPVTHHHPQQMPPCRWHWDGTGSRWEDTEGGGNGQRSELH